VTLRPTREDTFPPSSSRLPKARAYAVTTHCRSTVVKCSDRCADGSAMFTTVASSTIISWARAMTARISQRLGSGAASPGGTAAAESAGGFAADMLKANLQARSPLSDRH